MVVANTNTAHPIWCGALVRVGLHSNSRLDRHVWLRQCARDKVETLHEAISVDVSWGPWKLFNGGKICGPRIFYSLLERRVK